MLRNLFDLYLARYARGRAREIKKAYSSPLVLQKKALCRILDKAKDTEFGKEYDFRSIKSVDAYQKRLPVFRYDDISCWIDKAVKGKPDIIWPGRISHFALTSGTGGKNKQIPVSEELMDVNRRAALDCLVFYLTQSKERLLSGGKFLFLGGSTCLEDLGNGALAGDLSGVVTCHIPLIARFMYEPCREIAFMPNWLDKIAAMAEREVNINIGGISGMPAWLLIFFDRLLEEASRIKNRHVGAVSEVWPDLSLIIHGGVNFEPFKNRFREKIGKEVYYLSTYPASEAFMAIQDRKNKDGLLLMLDYGIFYEFIPEEDVGKPAPARLTIADVEVGKNYAILLTNCSGLFSYLLGDTVRFLELDPPRLVVTGRIENFLSAFGEHLIVEEAEAAVHHACKETGSEIEEFTAAPFFPEDLKKLPHHQWLIEFRKEPRDTKEFVRLIDAKLREMNDDYNAHRVNAAGIHEPEVITLRKGAFYDWMRSEGKLGGQNKVPRLKNDRSIADKLLRVQQ